MTQFLDYDFILRHVWLIPAMPLFSFALVGLVIRPMSAKLAGIVATALVFASAVMSWVLAAGYFHSSVGTPVLLVP